VWDDERSEVIISGLSLKSGALPWGDLLCSGESGGGARLEWKESGTSQGVAIMVEQGPLPQRRVGSLG